MALVEVTNPTDKVEIVGPFKHVQLRAATWVEKDGVRIGQPEYHRRVISPLDDVSNESAEIQAICAAIHTPEVVAAYQAHIASQGV